MVRKPSTFLLGPSRGDRFPRKSPQYQQGFHWGARRLQVAWVEEEEEMQMQNKQKSRFVPEIKWRSTIQSAYPSMIRMVSSRDSPFAALENSVALSVVITAPPRRCIALSKLNLWPTKSIQTIEHCHFPRIHKLKSIQFHINMPGYRCGLSPCPRRWFVEKSGHNSPL